MILQKTSSLDALFLFSIAWKSVQYLTVRNCFHKGGFTQRSNSDEDEVSDQLFSLKDIEPRRYGKWLNLD